VAIEDTATGAASAKAAGMRVIGIDTPHGRSALTEADAVVERLVDIGVASPPHNEASRFVFLV
jgi:beta-phosphoglucomutase-like phosphatase (HAD superfamily)